MIARDELHELVERLSDQDVPAAQSYLRYLTVLARDPLLKALAEAPIDDEPESEEERQAVAEGRAEIARGQVYTWEQVRAELEEMDSEGADGDQPAKKAS